MKKWLIRIGIGVGVILLVTGGVTFAFHLRGKAQLVKKIAELKAQGLPTTFAELEAKYKLPEGTPNAADIYMDAFAAYKPLSEDKQNLLPVMGDQSEPNANEPYPPEQMAAAAEFVELNQEMFALLSEGGKVKDCDYPMDYSHGPFPKNDHLLNVKTSFQSLSIAGIYYSQTNQPQKAYEAIMDQLRLGQSLYRSPNLINHFVRIAILAMGTSDIQGIINRTTLDESHLLQLQEYLQSISTSITIGPALLGETCFCLEYNNMVHKGALNVMSAEDKMGYYAGVLMPQNSTVLIEAYQRLIEIDRLPVQEQFPMVEEVIKETMNANIFIYIPKMIMASMEKVYMIHLRVRANVDCAITAIAIERYRLKEGKLPETVEALVPDYLPQVYVDPFDGNPLRYKQMDMGYMIYTIGADGVDDGGRERGPNECGENLDWVFRVYRRACR